jgi:ankyrin repeat protein
MTVFHLAVLRSETRMFYLLGEGADPTILTEKKRNALHLACRARQSNAVGYLCQVSLGVHYLLLPTKI